MDFAIAFLGGKCAQCGAVSNLEVDHINPSEKEYEISSLFLHARGSSIVAYELSKCQLLCFSCHCAKHATAKGTHGTLSAFRHCKCQLCRKAKAAYMLVYQRKYRAKKKEERRQQAGDS